MLTFQRLAEKLQIYPFITRAFPSILLLPQQVLVAVLIPRIVWPPCDMVGHLPPDSYTVGVDRQRATCCTNFTDHSGNYNRGNWPGLHSMSQDLASAHTRKVGKTRNDCGSLFRCRQSEEMKACQISPVCTTKSRHTCRRLVVIKCY